MVAIVREVLESIPSTVIHDMEDLIQADEEARAMTKQIVTSYKVNT